MRKQHRVPARLAVLTVTHNSGHALPGLLESVARYLPDARVVVVDCASTDESVAVAERSGARVIALDQNVGFGRGCNRGMLEVAEPVTALLNPDVELLDDSLLELANQATARDRLLAPLVLSPDGSRQDTVHPLPGTAPELLGSVLTHRVPALAPWRSRSARRVGWAVGCAVVARTETLRRLGPFDEQIFMYGEDLDLSIRAAERGIETWFWPAARVLHHRAHSSGPEFGGEPFDRLARARRDVVSRRLGTRVALLDDLSQAVTFGVRLAVKRLIGRDCARERRQLQALARARRGR
jgi:GT2 family glycosyltransferase